MPEWLLITLGILIGLVVVIGVFFVVNTPRPLMKKRSRLAPRSGRSDEEGLSNITSGWTSDP